MKAGKGSKIVKRIASMVSFVAKSKCSAIIRTKADAVKARLMLAAFTILSRRKKFSIKSIDRTANNNFCNNGDDYEIDDINCNAIVVRGSAARTVYEEEDDDKYPDLTHSLFDEEEAEVIADLLEDTNASAIDQVKNSKEDCGKSFNLEDEIDEVADLFINKFHKKMRLQKLLSFKRHQKMMERSV